MTFDLRGSLEAKTKTSENFRTAAIRMTDRRYVFGRFLLDAGKEELRRDGLAIAVSRKGLLLLLALVRAAGQVVDKSELMESAWPGAAVEESNLSVQIAALRKLLGPANDGREWIVTIPRLGYRFAGDVSERFMSDDAKESGPASHDYLERRPSVAVLPFEIVGDSSDKEHLADGITDDIIMSLARFRWFRVVARSSSFAQKGKAADARHVARELDARYLVTGTIRQSDREIRISAQLIDAATGVHVWTERYKLDFADVFAIQDEIAERVAGAIEPELRKTEGLAATRHTGNITAWELVRRGTWLFHKIARESHLEARELFRRACSIDPELAEAHIWLARVSAGIIAYGWSSDLAADAREGLEAGARAIRLDPTDPYAHYGLAIVSAYGGLPGQALLAAERAVEINSSFALGYLVLGMARLFGGEAEKAIQPLQHGLKLNPNDPQNFAWFDLLALAQLFSGKSQEAIASAKMALKVRPNWHPAMITLAVCHSVAKDRAEATRLITRTEILYASAGSFHEPLKHLNPHWDEMMARALAEIGTT